MTLPASLAHPCYHDDDAACEMFEAIRWPDGPYCPHCGCFDTVTLLGGKSMGPGWYWCNKCREKFTARVGSFMERSHIAIHKWLLAFRLMASSKKGMSAHQLHRMLNVSYKAAWFMTHHIRETMRPTDSGQLGGEGKTVEADETYVGGKVKNHAYAKTLPCHEAVMSLVERGGKVCSHHIADVTATTLKPILVETIAKDTHFRTEQSPVYTDIGKSFAGHVTVNYSIKSMFAAMFTLIRSRVIPRSSSAVSMAPTIMSAWST